MQGFSTSFFSAQSEQQLRYIKASICPKYIDSIKSLDDIDPNIADSNAADDLVLIEELKKLNISKKSKQFIVLHQRGTHGPFNLRYPKEFAHFTPIDSPRDD